MSQDLVVQNSFNPFARNAGPSFEGLAVGNAAIEMERAVAEAQGALTLAKRFPRDPARAYATIMETCKRKSFAETASYAFPRGGQTVTGPTIRLAEELARAWGNIDFGLRELSRGDGVSEMEAYAWDLETNTRTSQRFVVRHKSLSKTQKDLIDERDIYERVANDGARRLRARILAILPPDVVDAAESECKKTLAGNNTEPIADRARKMVAAFATLGVQATHLQERLGHSLETSLPEEFVELQQIFVSIRDGVTRASEWFGANASGGNTEPAATEPATPAAAVARALTAPVADKPARGRPKKTEEKPEPAPELPKEIPSNVKEVPEDYTWSEVKNDLDIEFFASLNRGHASQKMQ